MAYKGLSLKANGRWSSAGPAAWEKSIAMGLAEAGADVVPVTRRAEEVSNSAAEIRALGRGTLELTADVTSRSEIQIEKCCKQERGGRFAHLRGRVGQAVFNPRVELMNRTCPPTSPFSNHLTCFLRVVCTT